MKQSLLDEIASKAKSSGKNAIAIDKYIYFGGLYSFPVPENSAEWSIWYPER